MTVDLEDTIAAIASAPGGALRGIVRLSGSKAIEIVARLFQPEDLKSIADLRTASCRRGAFQLRRNLGLAPATLYLWPTSSSYTRQPSVELHLPGSAPLLDAALEAVCASGPRLARPGAVPLRAC